MNMDEFSERLLAAVEIEDIQSVENLLQQIKSKSPGEKQRLSVKRKSLCLRAIALCSLPLLKLLFTDDIFYVQGNTKALVHVEFMEHAVKFKNIPAIDFLYENGFKFDMSDNLPLHFICKIPETAESLKCLHRIISVKFGVNIVNKQGQTALMICAEQNPSYMKLLLDAGADVNFVNTEGKTALMMICTECYYNNETHVKVLLDAGADVNFINKEGETALMICAQRNPKRIKLLLDAGADVNIVNKENQTALQMICAEYNSESIKHFLSNPNTRDKHGRTILQYASSDLDSLELFLQYGGAVSLDIKTASGRTPFQYVLNSTRYSMFWHLLAENCNLESFKSNSSSPSKIVMHIRNQRVKLGKILYLCGAPKEIIQKELQFKSNDEKRFHRYCNNVPLKELCRRRLRNCIGVGIQQKLSNDCQIPGLLHDFIMLKDIFPAEVFDPNKISQRSYRDKNPVFKVITLNDDDDDGDDDDYRPTNHYHCNFAAINDYD